MTIYMISYGEDMINEEYGYFSSEESAERYVRNLDAEKHLHLDERHRTTKDPRPASAGRGLPCRVTGGAGGQV